MKILFKMLTISEKKLLLKLLKFKSLLMVANFKLKIEANQLPYDSLKKEIDTYQYAADWAENRLNNLK